MRLPVSQSSIVRLAISIRWDIACCVSTARLRASFSCSAKVFVISPFSSPFSLFSIDLLPYLQYDEMAEVRLLLSIGVFSNLLGCGGTPPFCLDH